MSARHFTVALLGKDGGYVHVVHLTKSEAVAVAMTATRAQVYRDRKLVAEFVSGAQVGKALDGWRRPVCAEGVRLVSVEVAS